MIKIAENINWTEIILLLQFPRVGRKTAKKLIDNIDYKISNADDLFDFINEKGKFYGLPEYSKMDYFTAKEKVEIIINESERKGIKITSMLNADYPAALKLSNDFPIVLSYIGDINVFNNKPGVAIIGTREVTDYGYKAGKRLGSLFAQNDFNVISGLAVGSDTAGHVGALEVNGISTAVLAHGLDSIYPKENKKLAEKIVDCGGILVSEYFVGTKPFNSFFIERDRIQAGLSSLIIVIETDIKGGTMHTVKFGTEYQRVLTCLKHPPSFDNYSKTQGNQMLLREKKALPINSSESVKTLIDNCQVLLNDMVQVIHMKNSITDKFLKNNNFESFNKFNMQSNASTPLESERLFEFNQINEPTSLNDNELSYQSAQSSNELTPKKKKSKPSTTKSKATPTKKRSSKNTDENSNQSKLWGE